MKPFRRDLNQLTDESLMARIQKGNEEALELLYQRYSHRLIHYFYRMLGSDHDKAQDFLHDLFLKIVDRPTAFDTRKPFSTWVFTVAHNLCKNEYRRLEVRSRETVLNEIRNAPWNGRTHDLDLDLDAAAFRQAVLGALKDFEPRHRTTFLLRYQEDLSIREISEVLGCAEGTTKSRLFYTAKKLADILEPLNPYTKESEHE